MSFPWLAWLTGMDGNILPLLLTIAFQAVYYFYGLYRLLNGKRPLPTLDNPETPDGTQ